MPHIQVSYIIDKTLQPLIPSSIYLHKNKLVQVY